MIKRQRPLAQHAAAFVRLDRHNLGYADHLNVFNHLDVGRSDQRLGKPRFS